MTACKPVPIRTKSRPVRNSRLSPTEALPPAPDKRLWQMDKARAFEAGVRWFLAVSSAA